MTLQWKELICHLTYTHFYLILNILYACSYYMRGPKLRFPHYSFRNRCIYFSWMPSRIWIGLDVGVFWRKIHKRTFKNMKVKHLEITSVKLCLNNKTFCPHLVKIIFHLKNFWNSYSNMLPSTFRALNNI